MDTCMHIAEKKELRDQIFQFKLENDKSLRILTNQLQHKLSEMDEKLQGNYKPNDTIEFANLKQKYQLLQGSYIHQKDELEILKNATMNVLQELFELKQLKSINQDLNMSNVQGKLQLLDQKTNSLTINQNARSQDFLALFNNTRVMENKINLMGNFITQILSHEIIQNATTATHFNIFNDLKNRVYEIETKQNATFADVISKIISLEGKVSNNSKRVAVTACVGSTQTFSDAVVRFSTVRSEIGINNIATFMYSGKFVCEIPGLYYISAHIRTSSGDYGFHVKKNNDYIAYSITDAGLSDSTNPISAVVALQIKDTLYVETSATIYSTYSCISIVKVK
ncbi:uncharacterized protein LOC134686187 [Mytilus trossulus]|uniref:uncharacterized protein LOC134686187 n=1 Tax=Mytilus trossulus TaxID=6551 RepID=UPI0030058C24